MRKSKWTRAQIDLLLEKTKQGNVRMHAFEEVAKQTRRKTNSVRNYYYKNLAKEKAVFASFSAVEVTQMLREIVLGTSRGESVRSICLRLANGDKAKMLRFQNKYRAVLKATPERIVQVKEMLEGQGYFVKLPYQTNFLDKLPSNVVTMPKREDKRLADADINNLFAGLLRLIKKQAEDGAKSQIDALKMEIESLKTHSKITKL